MDFAYFDHKIVALSLSLCVLETQRLLATSHLIAMLVHLLPTIFMRIIVTSLFVLDGLSTYLVPLVRVTR